MNVLEAVFFSPWIELLGGWLWKQSLAVLLILPPILFLARLKYFKDPRVQTFLWGAIFVRLALPVMLTVSIDGSALEKTHLGQMGLHPIEETLSGQVSAPTQAGLPAPDLLPATHWLVAIWALAVLWLSLRWQRTRRRYARVLRGATPVEDPRIVALAARWRLAHAIKRPIKLVTNKSDLSPFTMGTLRPVIFLPREVMQASPSALEAVLAHEMAHVKALDDLKIMLQRGITALFFFHPVVWLCGRKLNHYRELARDRDVLSRRLLDFRQYGKGILDAVRSSMMEPVGVPALGSLFPQRINALREAGTCQQKKSLWPGLFIFLGLFSLPMVAISAPEPPVTQPQPSEPIAWQSPLPNGWVSSGFGMRKNPFNGEMNHHRGTDLVGEKDAAILAPASGRVVLATTTPENPDWGTTLILQHEQGFQTFFAHLQDLRVAQGQEVKKGQEVATLGATGKVAGRHLHFEVWRGTTPVDPGDLISDLKEGKPRP